MILERLRPFTEQLFEATAENELWICDKDGYPIISLNSKVDPENGFVSLLGKESGINTANEMETLANEIVEKLNG